MSDELNIAPENRGEAAEQLELAAARTTPPEPPSWRPGRENPSWTGWDVLAIFVMFFLSYFLVHTVALVIGVRSGWGKAADLIRDPRLLIPAQFVAYVAVIFFMAIVVRSRAPSFLRELRWNFPYRTVAAWVVIGTVLAFVVQTTSGWLPIPKSLPIEDYFRSVTGAWLMTLFGVSMGPFVEELLFRGFLYPALTRRLGAILSVLLTSAGFALLHEAQLARAWAPLLLLFVVGLVLTLVRARTGSVAAGFLVHAGYNATLFVMLYLGSDGFRHLEKIGS